MGTNPTYRPTAERLFRTHIAQMREFAAEIESVIGTGPIVKRIRTCADECEASLNRISRREQSNA